MQFVQGNTWQPLTFLLPSIRDPFRAYISHLKNNCVIATRFLSMTAVAIDEGADEKWKVSREHITQSSLGPPHQPQPATSGLLCRFGRPQAISPKVVCAVFSFARKIWLLPEHALIQIRVPKYLNGFRRDTTNWWALAVCAFS